MLMLHVHCLESILSFFFFTLDAKIVPVMKVFVQRITRFLFPALMW